MEVLEKVKEGACLSKKSQITTLYEEAFPVVAKFISSVGDSFSDAKDIFHDAMVIFIEKKTCKKTEIIQSDKAYIIGIAKHLWISKYKNDKKKISLNGMESKINIPDDYFPTPDKRRLLNILKVAGKKCLNLLRAFYFQQTTVSEIAEEFGFLNARSASVQKHKCMEKVRKTVKEKSLSYEEFTK